MIKMGRCSDRPASERRCRWRAPADGRVRHQPRPIVRATEDRSGTRGREGLAMAYESDSLFAGAPTVPDKA